MEDQSDRIQRLEDRLASQRRVIWGIALIVAGVGAFKLGLSLRPESIPFRPDPGVEDMNGLAQIIVFLTGAGWLGMAFDGPDLFDRPGVYLSALGLLSLATLGLYAQ